MNHLSRRKALARFATVTTVAIALSAALTTGKARAATPVTYLLAAPMTLPAYAPWVIAQQKGYYAAEDLDMKFVAASGGVDVAKQLGAGNAMIGSATGDTTIIARANGIPVKTVSLLGQGSLMMLTTPKSSNIASVSELKGKVISVMSYGDTTYYALLGVLREAGLSKTDVDIQGAGPAGVWQMLASGKAAAMAGVPDWVASVEETGMQTSILKAGPRFVPMAQAIIASDAAISEHPDIVQKVVRATLKGLNDIQSNPQEAAQVYIKANPKFAGQEANIARVFDLYKTYVYGASRVTGEVSAAREEAVQKFYVDEKIVRKASPIELLYTNQFAIK